MADRISARRALASSFFLTAQSALVALVATTSKKHWAFAVPGLVLAVTWWLLLRSYRHLNTEKFKVIQKMEKRLPASPFQDEWDALKHQAGKQVHQRYVELGLLERVVPFVFALIFIVILVAEV
jgi:nitrate/nitrite transporter NarK